jgi:hypothetical protein
MVTELLQLAEAGASAALLALLVTAMERFPDFCSEGGSRGSSCRSSGSAVAVARETPRAASVRSAGVLLVGRRVIQTRLPTRSGWNPVLTGSLEQAVLAADCNAVAVRCPASPTNVKE